MHGFDTSTSISAGKAAALRTAGFTFAIRYLSRSHGQHAGDLTTAEAQRILNAGLALMPVQHVPPSPWSPTQALGTTNGANAAFNAQQVGFPPGVNVWLDLEGVKISAAAQDVIDFCNAWFAQVEGAGYVTGVYVGASAILTGDQLFFNLKTKHYWKSGSTVPDIPHRGYQMIQRIVPGDVVAGVEIDRNLTIDDGFGDAVQLLA